MNEVLKLIVLRLDPDREYERSPYMGRGSTARHYHYQYVKAIDELGGDNEMFTLNFEWPSPIIIPEIGEDSPASRVG